MPAKLQTIKKHPAPFLIELEPDLNAQLRKEKPANLSLRRFIVVLVRKALATRLYN